MTLVTARPPGSDFFAAIAQLIPVLVLAIVVERRLWEKADVSRVFGVDLHLREDGDGLLRGIAAALVVLVIATLFAGEAFALIGLQGHSAAVSTYFCWEAVAVGAFTLVWPILGVAIRCLVPAKGQARFDTHAGRVAVVIFLLALIVATVVGLGRA